MINPFRRVQKLEKERLIAEAFKVSSDLAEKKKFSGSAQEIARQKEGLRIKTTANYVHSRLKGVVRSYPDYDRMPELYRRLATVFVTEKKLKKSIASLNWAANKIKDMQMAYHRKMKFMRHTQQMRALRTEFYGRLASFLRKIKKDMALLSELAPIFSRFPDLQEVPTVIITGLPNVGKSSLLRRLSSALPKVQSYPFTTKGLMLGYTDIAYKKVQFIDTPGLLDRPLSKRSKIEMQAIVALDVLGDLIIYMFDLSETCGYTVKQQVKMYYDIKVKLNKPIIPVANKTDILGGKPLQEVQKHFDEKIIPISCETGEGIKELRKYLNKFFKALPQK